MAITRPTESMTKEEQFREVAQILAIALKRWHKDAKCRVSDRRRDREDPDAGNPIEGRAQRPEID